MDIGQYIEIVLGHPKYGYYVTRDPLGQAGDFTTSPEISQMFGEMLGAYFAHQWMNLGSPARFTFLECGPGRGTLMADMMRIGKAFDGFRQAVEIHLVEISPVLRQKQAEALRGYGPVWHEDVSTVPDDVPILMVGNEFLDALPLRQFVMEEEGWCERYVDYNEEAGFHYINASSRDGLERNITCAAEIGDILEVAPLRDVVVQELCRKMKASGGAALLIDYGHIKTAPGDTFQAMKGHLDCDVLEHIGEADLTTHVDFEALKVQAEKMGAKVSDSVTQAAFLNLVGIAQRAEILRAKATPAQAEDIESAYHRLTDHDKMGALFKVIAINYER